jgi:peptidoglycan/LPS O-acetylase OafA/YrhL
MNLRYRRDIDGLRAVAVVPVVLFHAGLKPFGGGYIGVDVFFVISGYLITLLIAGEIEQGRFSIVRFYERRVRRILPALFAVVFFGSIAASRLLTPQQYKMFAKSVFATAVFASNVLFWLESSYFDPPAAMKPLLHTWSLAVEEQFYIVFPLFLLIIHRWLKGQYIVWLAPIAVLSFAASVWGVVHDPTATFYLAPTRAWELALGSLLALDAFPQLRQRLWRELVGLLGLVLIAWGVFAFTYTTPFPGTNALFPAGGAALVIYSGNGCETTIGKVLGLRPLVFIGLISYSLYLWHWPLLVFAQVWNIDELTAGQKGVIVVLSFLLAVLSWRFVELPFRRPAGVVRRIPLFGGAAAAITCFTLFGLFGYFSDGWPSRFPSRVRTIAAAIDDWDFPKGLSVVANAPDGIYEINTKSNKATLFFGDSHAMQYSPRVVSLVSKNPETYNNIIFAVYSACPPIPNVFTGWNAHESPHFLKDSCWPYFAAKS